jgi:hypothetical protein
MSSSRYRPARLIKRLRHFLLVAGVVLLLLLVGLLVGLKSEAFWKRFVFPQFFGPYWETVLTWDRFSPGIFPPSLNFENLVLREPGDEGTEVVRIAELEVVSSLWSRPWEVVLRSVEARGVRLHVTRKENLEISFVNAMARLYDGMPPADYSVQQSLLPRILLTTAAVEDFEFRFDDLTRPGLPLRIDYAIKERTPFSALDRRADLHLSTSAQGPLVMSMADFYGTATASVDVTMTDLQSFPRSFIRIVGSATGEGGDPARIDFSTEIPFERFAIRASALPYRAISVDVRPTRSSSSVATLRGGLYDPLRGHVNLDWDARFTRDQLAAIATSFIPEAPRARVLQAAKLAGADAMLMEPIFLTMVTSGTLSSTGMAQWGIVDPSEVLPLKLAIKGGLHVDGLEHRHFPPFLAEQFGMLQGMGLLYDGTGRLAGEIDLQLDQEANSGALRSQISLTPTTGNGYTASFLLADQSSPKNSLRFQPFTTSPPAPVEPSLLRQGPQRPLLFPAFDEWLAWGDETVRGSTAIFDAVALTDARAAFAIDVRDRTLLSRFTGLFFRDVREVQSASFGLDLTRKEPGAPLRWAVRAAGEGIALPDLPGTFSIIGSSAVMQDDSILRAEDVTLDLLRTVGDRSTTYTLLLEDSLGEEAALLDLSRGTGSVNVQLQNLNREIMEIILRIQTFGLSETLARPFYQRMLDFLGFRPTDPTAVTQASATLSLELGEVFEVRSRLQARSLPASNFFFLTTDEAPQSERFDAVLLQELSLDRASALLALRKLHLSLSPSGGKQTFAEIFLDADDTARFAYDALQQLAGDPTATIPVVTENGSRSVAFRRFVSALFDRVAALRQTLRQGTARVFVRVPRLDLSEFTRTLSSAGVPVRSGILQAEMVSYLSDILSAGDRAEGSFQLEGLRLGTMEEAFPPAVGRLLVDREGSNLRVHEISTELQFLPDAPPTALRFDGELRTDSLDSTWSLQLAQVNGGVLQALGFVENAGIAAASQLVRALPMGALSEVASGDGSIDLRLDARTNSARGEAILETRQTGRSLVILKDYLRPLSFDLFQQVTANDQVGLAITRLEGNLSEEGNPAPLAELNLDSPVSIAAGSNSGSDDASETRTLTLAFRRSLQDQAGILTRYPLPFINRSIQSGLLSGRWDVMLPSNFGTEEARQEGVWNQFALELSDVLLSGYGRPITGTIEGSFHANDEGVRIEDTRADLLVAGESAGAVGVSAHFDTRAETLRTTVDLIRFTPALLDMFPPAIHQWTGSRASRLDLRAEFEGLPLQGEGSLVLRAAGRDLAVPPQQLPDGTLSTHPPLAADLAVSASYDTETSSVLFRDLALLVAKGNRPAERLAPISHEATPLLAVNLMAPFRYRADTVTLEPVDAEGSGLQAAIGPIDVAEYSQLLSTFVGLPLQRGLLSAEGFVRATAGGAYAHLEAKAELANGLWRHSDGREQSFSLSADALAQRRRNVIRLDHAEALLSYDRVSTDSLSAEGYLEFDEDDQRPEAELNIRSKGLAIDRLLGFVDDVQIASPQEPSEPPSIADLAQFEQPTTAVFAEWIRRLSARLTVELQNVTMKTLAMPTAKAEATMSEGVVRLERVTAEVAGGEIMMTGLADLGTTSGLIPWQFMVGAEQLRFEPFVTSFVPTEWQGIVSGAFSGRLDATGSGFSDAALRSAEVRGDLSVREMVVRNPTLERVFGEGAIGADSRLLVSNNRALFDLTTPWNPSRDLIVRGSIRELLPESTRLPWLELFADFTRTTTVGPSGRFEEDRGVVNPYRQPLFGVTVRAVGPVGGEDFPLPKLQTIRY